MAFLGKEYTFESQENFEDFVNALGLTPEQTQGYLNYKPSVQVTKDGDSYTLTTTFGGNKKETTFKSGVAFEEQTNNRTAQTTYTVDGNTITQVQNFGGDGILTSIREFSGDTLTLTLKSSKTDVVGRRHYKA